jgi:ubiquitin-protein ligase E3 C
MFWQVVGLMTPIQQGNFLKFVTSCSRQPLLGFSQLTPPFAIQKVPLYETGDVVSENIVITATRLPTASTCMNLLKLPQYNSFEELQAKLTYAVMSNSGFELT